MVTSGESHKKSIGHGSDGFCILVRVFKNMEKDRLWGQETLQTITNNDMTFLKVR